MDLGASSHICNKDVFSQLQMLHTLKRFTSAGGTISECGGKITMKLLEDQTDDSHVTLYDTVLMEDAPANLFSQGNRIIQTRTSLSSRWKSVKSVL
jgi:hypothetical protein